MTIVAEEYDHVMGVDTHARTHTYAIVDTATGACLATESFPTTAAAIGRAIGWMKRNTNGNVLAAVEGTSSYGAGLSCALKSAGIPVAEVKPPHRQARAGVGKSDPIDAVEAARQVLHRDVDRLAAALRVLLTGRRGLDTRRTADRNALNALVRTTDLGIDARKALTAAQVTMIAWPSEMARGSFMSVVVPSLARNGSTTVSGATALRGSNFASHCQWTASRWSVDLVKLLPQPELWAVVRSIWRCDRPRSCRSRGC